MIAPPDVALEPASGDNVPPEAGDAALGVEHRRAPAHEEGGERERDGRALSPPRA